MNLFKEALIIEITGVQDLIDTLQKAIDFADGVNGILPLLSSEELKKVVTIKEYHPRVIEYKNKLDDLLSTLTQLESDVYKL